jgi:periplasmic copper chaperone A
MNVPAPRRAVAVLVVAILSFGLAAACGDSTDEADTIAPSAAEGATTSMGSVSTTTPVDVGLVAAGAWMRSSPMIDAAGAAYMTITNTGSADDELVDASVPTDVAGLAEIHETAMGEGGMMAMRRVTSIPVPAGQSVELAPGGYHVMVLELVDPLEVGDEVPVTLVFASGIEVTVTAEVRAA